MRSEGAEAIVIGAGPAGMAAAATVARHGLKVAILDETPLPGGQVYRAPPAGFAGAAKSGAEGRHGDRLRAELAASGARFVGGARVWRVSPGFEVEAELDGTCVTWSAPLLLAATGATERLLPVPGWTLPGVIGLAAATILLKAQRMAPGRRSVVAGSGPLLYAVAAGILEGGGEVAAVVDTASAADWARLLPAMAARPDLLLRGFGWQARVRRAGVPVLGRAAIRRIEGEGHVEAVLVGAVDGSGAMPERRFACDAVALGHGLVPGIEVTGLLRARHAFDAGRGGWVATHDAWFRSSVPGLLVAGDGAGIRGAAAAELQGRIAGHALATAAGRLAPAQAERLVLPLRRRMARAERLGAAMAEMMRPPPGLIELATPETVICRCEDVTRAEIEDALARGARQLNQVKAWTRCGMGPCQGRICGEAAAELAARHSGGREAVGGWTPRVPIRPVHVGALTGAFDYDDVLAAMPPPAAT